MTGGGGAKIGNAHLKWAFSEAACLLARESAQAKRFLARKEKQHGKPKALGILVARLGRAVYHMLRQKRAFDAKRFWNGEPNAAEPHVAFRSAKGFFRGAKDDFLFIGSCSMTLSQKLALVHGGTP